MATSLESKQYVIKLLNSIPSEIYVTLFSVSLLMILLLLYNKVNNKKKIIDNCPILFL